MKTVVIVLAGGSSNYAQVTTFVKNWSGIFDDLILSVKSQEQFIHLDLGDAQIIEDIRQSGGPMAGLEAAMSAVPAEHYFLTAVELSYGTPELALALFQYMGTADVCLIQRKSRGVEPLFAFYSRRCLPAITDALNRGKRSFYRGLLPIVNITKVAETRLLMDKDGSTRQEE